MESSILAVAELYQIKGDLHYDGEGVSQLAHAWQCGQLAKDEGAGPQLQLAAWLHDIGHLLSKKEGTPTSYGFDDQHEQIGGNYLARLFSEEVSRPVLMHVLAKRYLVTTYPEYRKSLSPDSVRSLVLQGGAMTQEECIEFMALPFSNNAISLRMWDESGKKSDMKMPAKADVINELLQLAEECR
ncbi:phosphohydrolase [Polynucleobacter sp. AP-Sanab-80-C2]|jgi:phosphonate degradation associated HDIG domain protein|uniref:phosphohydrolase n=1 Tax=Polynucleobacter sp. AP-Sanab-80-C2 TaxID=3108274 RepID=UPI002B2339A7|nr:phosphohydrolase [Polynucleobacter sp. AP-Sanab-80-C2]MEA9599642.1 phosphohydrolase [Polynucleobacter sp. AP-Sanab-80-C2]